MTILIIWVMLLSGVLLVMGVNLIKAYAVKETASIGAEQASIAATDVVYDYVLMAVRDYDESLIGIGEGLLEGKSVEKKIKDEQSNLMLFNNTLNENQALHVAVNTVLKQELSGNEKLKSYIMDGLSDSTNEISAVVSNVISQNGGKSTGFKVQLFDSQERIVVEGKATFKSSGNLFDSLIKDLSQTGKGPSIPFIEKLSWSNKTLGE